MMVRSLWPLAACAVFSSIAGSTSASESFCVSCSGPQASYLCEVSVPDGVVPTQSPQLYCAYKLASEGQHASCASRRADAASCQGEPRKLSYLGPSLSGPSTPAEPVAEPDAASPVEDTSEPANDTATTSDAIEATQPASEDLAEDPGGDSAEKDTSRVTDGVEADWGAPAQSAERSTGDKIASAAMTAFNCLASFFKECKE